MSFTPTPAIAVPQRADPGGRPGLQRKRWFETDSDTVAITVNSPNQPPVTRCLARRRPTMSAPWSSRRQRQRDFSQRPGCRHYPVQVTLAATQGTLTLYGITDSLSPPRWQRRFDHDLHRTLANINTALNGLTFSRDPFRSSGTAACRLSRTTWATPARRRAVRHGFGDRQHGAVGTPYMITGLIRTGVDNLAISGLVSSPTSDHQADDVTS